MKSRKNFGFLAFFLITLSMAPSFGFIPWRPEPVPTSIYDAYRVATIAGQVQEPGSTDGSAAVSQFQFPSGLLLGPDGSLYVAGNEGHTIRKITPEGVVTTIAGAADQEGTADGIGSAARFKFPTGLAFDVHGNLLVTDLGNNTIRRITPTGVVTTVAGMPGQSGYRDGLASQALFSGPLGIVVDEENQIFVTDINNNVLRKIDAEGVVTTLAGQAGQSGSREGYRDEARFGAPWGIVRDATGNLYVSDSAFHTISRVSPAGSVRRFVGSPGSASFMDGAVDIARFKTPRFLATDGRGNIYVADQWNHLIRRVDVDGNVRTLAGMARTDGAQDGLGSEARFYYPCGIAVSAVGKIYVSDQYNHTIRKLSRQVITNGTDGLFAYRITDGILAVTGYAGTNGSVTIPSVLAGLPVSEIAANAFQSPAGITNIVIPDTVVLVGSYAFSGLAGLRSLNIPPSVVSIEAGALSLTGLTNITVPANVQSLGAGALRGCIALTNATLLCRVTAIPNYLFRGSVNLQTVSFPTGVQTIGQQAFENCSSLRHVNLPDSVISIGEGAFSYATGLTAINIPLGVTVIRHSTFRDTGLTNVTLPQGITVVVDSAFYNCTALTRVNLPDSVNVISFFAFGQCTNLTQIVLPDSLSTIGLGAFAGCAFPSINIPRNVQRIDDYAFDSCLSLTSFTVDPLNTKFRGIGGVLHDKTGLTILGYPAGKAGPYLIPDGVQSVAASSFRTARKLTRLVMPSSITSIGEGAFDLCTALTNVQLSSSLGSLPAYAFSFCSALTSISLPSGITSIGSGAFHECAQLSSVSIPFGVTDIYHEAFKGCSSLGSITFPSSLKGLEYGLLADCVSLTNVTILPGPTYISSAFEGCTKLESIVLPWTLETLGYHAFLNCASLRTLFVPKRVRFLGGSVFAGCAQLKTLFFEGFRPWPIFDEDTGEFTPPFDANNLPAATLYFTLNDGDWTPDYFGLPTQRWNGRITTSGSDFGIRDGKFSFGIAGPDGLTVEVETTDDLENPFWLPVGRRTFENGLASFQDIDSATSPEFFFRFRIVP